MRLTSSSAEARDLAQAKAQRATIVLAGFERAVPVAGIDVGRPHLDAMFLRVAHELGRRIEAHRLGVEQGGGEDLGVVVLHPRGVVDQDGEARGVALREAVFAEAFDLLEAAFGEFALVAVADHAFDEVALELVDRAGPAERRHGAAQLVGFGGREACADDGDLHGLLLEQRHAVRSFQDAPELVRDSRCPCGP